LSGLSKIFLFILFISFGISPSHVTSAVSGDRVSLIRQSAVQQVRKQNTLPASAVIKTKKRFKCRATELMVLAVGSVCEVYNEYVVPGLASIPDFQLSFVPDHNPDRGPPFHG
jgi:hypothetical protein